ncbi:unnamed protein product [Pedinophyceae sp. YPF-701]|nr:unnamed protein product [Pedinophyceae sp. YPF-701]
MSWNPWALNDTSNHQAPASTDQAHGNGSAHTISHEDTVRPQPRSAAPSSDVKQLTQLYWPCDDAPDRVVLGEAAILTLISDTGPKHSCEVSPDDLKNRILQLACVDTRESMFSKHARDTVGHYVHEAMVVGPRTIRAPNRTRVTFYAVFNSCEAAAIAALCWRTVKHHGGVSLGRRGPGGVTVGPREAERRLNERLKAAQEGRTAPPPLPPPPPPPPPLEIEPRADFPPEPQPVAGGQGGFGSAMALATAAPAADGWKRRRLHQGRSPEGVRYWTENMETKPWFPHGHVIAGWYEEWKGRERVDVERALRGFHGARGEEFTVDDLTRPEDTRHWSYLSQQRLATLRSMRLDALVPESRVSPQPAQTPPARRAWTGRLHTPWTRAGEEPSCCCTELFGVCDSEPMLLDPVYASDARLLNHVSSALLEAEGPRKGTKATLNPSLFPGAGPVLAAQDLPIHEHMPRDLHFQKMPVYTNETVDTVWARLSGTWQPDRGLPSVRVHGLDGSDGPGREALAELARRIEELPTTDNSPPVLHCKVMSLEGSARFMGVLGNSDSNAEERALLDALRAPTERKAWVDRAAANKQASKVYVHLFLMANTESSCKRFSMIDPAASLAPDDARPPLLLVRVPAWAGTFQNPGGGLVGKLGLKLYGHTAAHALPLALHTETQVPLEWALRQLQREAPANGEFFLQFADPSGGAKKQMEAWLKGKPESRAFVVFYTTRSLKHPEKDDGKKYCWQCPACKQKHRLINRTNFFRLLMIPVPALPPDKLKQYKLSSSGSDAFVCRIDAVTGKEMTQGGEVPARYQSMPSDAVKFLVENTAKALEGRALLYNEWLSESETPRQTPRWTPTYGA